MKKYIVNGGKGTRGLCFSKSAKLSFLNICLDVESVPGCYLESFAILTLVGGYGFISLYKDDILL